MSSMGSISEGSVSLGPLLSTLIFTFTFVITNCLNIIIREVPGISTEGEGATFLQYHAAMGNVWLLNIGPKTKHKQLIHIEAYGMASLYQIKMSPLWLKTSALCYLFCKCTV